MPPNEIVCETVGQLIDALTKFDRDLPVHVVGEEDLAGARVEKFDFHDYLSLSGAYDAT